jgi:dienelactone hydrolase
VKHLPLNICVCSALLLLALCGCDNTGAPLPVDEEIMSSDLAARLLMPEGSTKEVKKVIVVPELPTAKEVAPGVVMSEVELTMENGQVTTLWVYRPDPLPPTKLPCVLIAPAGTFMVHGMSLSNGDQAEHIPYVQAGFAVIAYDLNGPANNNSTNAQLKQAILEFRKSGSGLNNASAAIDYAEKKIPFIDSNKFYTAGHSSAGGVALYVAQKNQNIKGAIAYAPSLDYPSLMGREFVGGLSTLIKDFGDYATGISPINHIKDLKCPTFIFYAADDQTISSSVVQDFSSKLRDTKTKVTVFRFPTGGHYDSMIQQGIPKGIEWLREQESL